MADEITMSIGPSGQPPTTVYTYSGGVVTLAPRAIVAHAPGALSSVIGRIDAFARAVTTGQAVPFSQPDTPFRYRVDANGPGPVVDACTFRAGALNTGASVDTSTKVTLFDARPQVDLAWADFELFTEWLRFLLTLAARPAVY